MSPLLLQALVVSAVPGTSWLVGGRLVASSFALRCWGASLRSARLRVQCVQCAGGGAGACSQRSRATTTAAGGRACGRKITNKQTTFAKRERSYLYFPILPFLSLFLSQNCSLPNRVDSPFSCPDIADSSTRATGTGLRLQSGRERERVWLSAYAGWYLFLDLGALLPEAALQHAT